MYAASKIGPWPRIDLEATYSTVTAATQKGTTMDSVIPYIDTSVLGSNTNAYIKYTNPASVSSSISASENASWAVALRPINNAEEPLIVDLYCCIYDIYGSATSLKASSKIWAFLGWSDNTSITAGWSANNEVSKLAHISWDLENEEHMGMLNTQVILDPVTSDHPTDKFLIFGFACTHHYTGSRTFIPDASISAAYRFSSLSTQYKGI